MIVGEKKGSARFNYHGLSSPIVDCHGPFDQDFIQTPIKVSKCINTYRKPKLPLSVVIKISKKTSPQVFFCFETKRNDINGSSP